MHVQDFWKTYVTPGVLTLVALTIAFITAGSVCTCKLCNLFCFELKLWYQPRQLRKPFWRVNFGSISAGHCVRACARARASVVHSVAANDAIAGTAKEAATNLKSWSESRKRRSARLSNKQAKLASKEGARTRKSEHAPTRVTTHARTLAHRCQGTGAFQRSSFCGYGARLIRARCRGSAERVRGI